MTEENAQELSPKEQYEQDVARVHAQLGVTEVTRNVTSIMGSIFGGTPDGRGPFTRSSFEGRDLNDMIDLVEQANPADLENAGKELWNARDALKDAAQALQDDVSKVHWEGESGTEFESFGLKLAEHARKLSEFADVAGTQITVAGTGLASVKMPPRDDRPVKRKPESIPPEERAANKAEYDKAVQVEKDRQEAINQMYKLASYYAVSEQTLAAQEPPAFDRTLKAKVPPPEENYYAPGPSQRATGTDAELSGTTPVQTVSDTPRAHGTADSPRTESIGIGAPIPDRNPSMEIDSVPAPPAPTAAPGQAPGPTATGPTSSPAARMPPVTNGFPNPVRGGTPRATGTSGVSRPGAEGAKPLGRAATAGSGPAAGRAAGSGPAPMGRSGGTGPVRAAGQSPVVGRPVGTAGQPTAGRAGTGPSAGAARGGRADGIVGGNPQRATSTGSSGSRIPRGTVIGAEGTAPGRNAALRVGQQGAIGAPGANNTPRSGGRVSAGPNGVVGTPSGGTPRSRSGAGGVTQGGSGLVRGTRGRKQSENEEQERAGSSRPDYLTEDEETWEVRRRGAVPPVIE